MCHLIYLTASFLSAKKIMIKEKQKIIQDSKIIVATHEYATGFAQHLEEYLKEKNSKKLLYIHHPLHPDYPNSNGSGYRIYKDGVLRKKISYFNIYHFLGLIFFKNFFQDIWFVIIQKEKWDLYIGSNNLNAFAGVILKKIGLVKKCVFYTVDFVPKRFKNSLINNVYLWIDLLCVRFCDETWILSPRVIEGRRKYFGLDKKFDKKQFYVPEGVWINRIKKEPFNKISKHKVIFLGVLLQRMGIQLILQAIPSIIQEIPDFRFIIIGKGNYKSKLEQLVKKLQVGKYIDFKGYVEDYKEIEKIIAKCALGVSTYTYDPTGLNYYADPAKVKTYLGCGLPVIMTNTFHNALEIEKKGAGIVVNDNPKEIAQTIISLIDDEFKLKRYRENAIKLAQEFDNETIFAKNLLRVLRH